ncbi:MAG: gliding motility lipoprotein GldH [Cellulophaga sp.]
MLRSLFFLLVLISFISCNKNVVKSEYKTTIEGDWSKDNIIEFTFSEIDTTRNHHMFINIRNDEFYAYSNLFLIAELTFPNGETVKDTLEYEMALPDGQWLGKGKGSLKESKLWYKENIVFPSSGVYTLQIHHAMRKNGNVDGIVSLEGITDVGYQIEKVIK